MARAGRVPALELPRPHAHGRADLRAQPGGVSLADLMDYLPRNNDPGCSAGFAHGLVTGVAPPIDLRQPRGAAGSAPTPPRATAATAVCTVSGTPSCGSTPTCSAGARPLPRAGSRAGPDCAQGAYHDYWFAVVGADDAPSGGPGHGPDAHSAVRSRRSSCARAGTAPLSTTGPRGIVVRLARTLRGDLRRPHRASALGLRHRGLGDRSRPSGAPARRCARSSRAPGDAASCVRGTKVQNLLGAPTADFVRLIGGCGAFAGAARGLLPLAREDDHRCHRRRVRPLRLPAARGRGPQGVRRGRAEHRRRTRDLQLT